jgi:hypothetical protein
MIQRGATGPGPRTVARPNGAPARPRPTDVVVRRLRRALVALSVSALALLVAACGANGPASPGGGSVAAGSPGAAIGSLEPGASVRRWPTGTIEATIALGAVDEQIANAGADLQTAVTREDVAAMWGAADGLAKLIDSEIPNIAQLEKDPATQAAGAIYRQAFPEISAGAKQLRDAITAGDSQAIVAGTQRLLGGLHAYEPARALIVDLVEQALTQKRMYLR